MTTPQPLVALVTGGNRGLGFEVCKQLAIAGMTVVMGARDPARGARSVATLRQRYSLDVRCIHVEMASPETAVEEVLAQHGHLDVLINNAATALDGKRPLLALTPAEIQTIISVNLLGALRLCHAVAPGMRARGYGRIVNVSSGRGSFSRLSADGAAYRISKAGLNAATVVLADELRGSGVLVNACTPGPVKTRMTAFKGKRTVEEGAREIVRLATLPDDGPTGGFFKDGEPFPW